MEKVKQSKKDGWKGDNIELVDSLLEEKIWLQKRNQQLEKKLMLLKK